MSDLEKEPEIDEVDDVDSPEPEPKLEVPADANEPIEVPDQEAVRESRRAKRAERQNQFRQLQEETSRQRRELDELRSQRQYQPQPQQTQVNPLQQRIQGIDKATADLHREYNAVASRPGFTPEMQEQYEQRSRDLMTARQVAITQAAAPRVDMEELVKKVRWDSFTSEHADVFHDKNPRVQQWAWAEYHRRIAEGQADTKDMVEEILDQTRVKFGKQPRRTRGSTPDQATRQRLSGVRAGGAGAGGDSGGTIPMDANMKKMARIAFGDRKDDKGQPWSEAKVYQYWANTVGKKMLSEKRK